MISALRLRRETRGGASLGSSSPTSSTMSPNSTNSSRWSWSSHDTEIAQNSEIGMDDGPTARTSPLTEEERSRILKARQRLARRHIELDHIIRYCNREMDVVRRKLVKDLQVM